MMFAKVRAPGNKAVTATLFFILAGLIGLVSSPTHAQDDIVDTTPLTDPPPVTHSEKVVEEGPARNISRFPEDYEQFMTMPLPAHSEIESTNPESRFVSYNLLTGEEHVSDVAFNLDEMAMEVKGSRDGADTDELKRPLNFSALSLVSNPENDPYRRNVKIFFDQGTQSFVCSGTLIDPLHVITAGHCVHEGNGGSWSTNVVVVPGYENGSRPYGDASAAQLHSWTGWTADGDWDHDIGIIDLNRPIGALTGWNGYGSHNDCDYFTGGTWRHDGYPGESPYNGQFMYRQSGDFDDCETVLGSWYGNEVSYNRYSYGGQSGTGANRDGTVWAVLSNGNSSTTWDVRITDTKFGHIRDTYIKDDKPSTFDLIPLDVNTTPANITAGSQLSSMNFLVHNYSSASRNGTVNLTIYLSENSNISTSDTAIGSTSFSWDFGPLSSVRVNVTVPPTIPVTTPGGSYWIGVILDTSDANNNNNDSDGQDASPITITSVPVPPAPTNVLSSDGTYLDKVRVTWNSVSGATYYEVFRATSSGGLRTKLAAPSSTAFEDFSAAVGIPYYYWIKACNSSGCSAYSVPDSGYRGGLPPSAPPTAVEASDGVYLTKVAISWDVVSGTTSFEIYRAQSPEGAKTKIGTSTSTSFDDTTAANPTTYFYWVKACNAWGCSDYSSYDDGYAGFPVPALISPADGSVIKNPLPTFEWDTVPGATEYNLQVDDNSDFSSPLVDIMTGSTNYTVTSMIENGPYYWHVQASNGAGSLSKYSDAWEVTLNAYKVYLPIIIGP